MEGTKVVVQKRIIYHLNNYEQILVMLLLDLA